MISLELAQKVKSYAECKVIPGQKLCKPCLRCLKEVVVVGEQREQDGAGGSGEVVEGVPETPNFEIGSSR